jgi:hypothetical protein
MVQSLAQVRVTPRLLACGQQQTLLLQTLLLQTLV